MKFNTFLDKFTINVFNNSIKFNYWYFHFFSFSECEFSNLVCMYVCICTCLQIQDVHISSANNATDWSRRWFKYIDSPIIEDRRLSCLHSFDTRHKDGPTDIQLPCCCVDKAILHTSETRWLIKHFWRESARHGCIVMIIHINGSRLFFTYRLVNEQKFMFEVLKNPMSVSSL